MPAPAAPKHGARDPLTKGFRPGAVPDTLLLARYFGRAKLLRRPIERADASWVHGRGEDPRVARLRGKRVAVIGCGSVGAPVAIALAQAGIGHLIPIDFDRLRWSNVGRHPLGASYVGQNKAKALAEKIRSAFPHITVEFRDADVDTDGFRTSWSKVCVRAGVAGLTFHDLRGSAVARLALAEATVPRIATFTGHSLKDVEAILDAHYLGRDIQLAEAAVLKLEKRTKL
jgi:integrase